MDPLMRQTAPFLPIPFLRSAVLRMRRIADGAPGDVADRLRRMASELDVETNGLSRLPGGG
jgi:hypothetical protein